MSKSSYRLLAIGATSFAVASVFASCAQLRSVELQRSGDNAFVRATDASAERSAPAAKASSGAQPHKIQPRASAETEAQGDAQGPRLTEAEKAFFASDEYKKRFAEAWMPAAGLEPELDNEQRAGLLDVLESVGAENLPEAEKKARALVTPDCSAAVDFMLGHVLARQNKYKEALENYRAATDKHETFRRAWVASTDAALRSQDFDEASKCASKAIKLGAGDGDLWGALGTAHFKLERFVSAAWAFSMAATLSPERVRWRRGFAECLFAQERYEEVAAYLEQMIREQPDAHGLWAMQGRAYAYLERWDKAAQNFEFIDSLQQSTPEMLNLLGGIYAKQENFSMATDAFLRGIRKGKTLSLNRALDTARFMIGADALDDVRKLLEGIEEARGDKLSKKEMLAQLRIRASLAVASGEGDESHAKILEEIVRVDPLDGHALILLGRHLARNKKEAEAITMFERAASVEKHRADALVRHAELLARRKAYKEALPLLRTAVQLKPREYIKKFLQDIERVAKQQG